LVIWTTFALCNIFYLKSVWPHPQKASSIWNNSWISSIITVCTIYIYIFYGQAFRKPIIFLLPIPPFTDIASGYLTYPW
jgi:hypothetical protein